MCDTVQTVITVNNVENKQILVVTENSLNRIVNLIKQIFDNAIETFQQIIESLQEALENACVGLHSMFVNLNKALNDLELLDKLPHSSKKEFIFCYYRHYGIDRTSLLCKTYNYIQDKRIKNMPYALRQY